LKCSSNPGLSALGLTGMTALTNLVCVGASIHTLDCSGCPALYYLDCPGNGMTALSIAGCANLTKLYPNNNSLTNLDISGSTLINELEVQGNNLPVSVVNSLLVQLDTNGVHGIYAYTSSQTPAAPPSGAGLTAKTNLISKGWGVTTD